MLSIFRKIFAKNKTNKTNNNKSKYPNCNTPKDCRFEYGCTMSTAMYSPIIRDRDGNAVGGGGNKVSTSLYCQTCKRRWALCGTELEFLQGTNEMTEVQDQKIDIRHDSVNASL